MKRTLAVDQTFNLGECLYLAQDFRWRELKHGWHSGVLRGNIVHIRQSGTALEFLAHSDLSELLTSYFRLDEDISAVHERLSSMDGRIARIVRKYPGLRVLRQPDPWECTVAYICSANANIAKITRSVEAIADALGREMKLGGEVRHTFPSVEEILDAGESRLVDLNLGLDKHKKIISAAERIHSGKLDLHHLAQPEVTYGDAKIRLTACYGIGPKVADCIALFALGKMQAFPVDTWVRKAVQEYFQELPLLYDEAIVQWAQDLFGEYAGYANQFLFTDQYERGRRASAERATG